MNKNKPTKPIAKKPVKKPNGRKSWIKVAKKVHELNKKKNLGWTWGESMRFASKKVYPKFKGQAQNRIKLTDIESEFNVGILDDGQNKQTPIPKTKQICDDPRNIPQEDLLTEHEWYSIAEDSIWNIFAQNVPMRFAFDGIVDTGIIPKNLMPDMVQIREDMRKLYGSSSPVPTFIFKLLVQPNKKDDGNPCSYYILVTMDGSTYDEAGDDEVRSKKTIGDLSPEEFEARANKSKKEKISKKEAKNRIRPKEIEPKTPPSDVKKSKKSTSDTELEKIKLQKSSRESLERILDGLRQDFKDGILSKRQ
jgi:hypothetical protein